MALLPGRVIQFIHPNKYKLWAVIQTRLGWQVLIPALRNMRLTQTINTRDTEIGSFLPTNKLKPRQIISNIIMQGGQQAQYIRAPGTFARVVDIKPRLKLQLTRKRSIILANTWLAQLGANAAHDHRHRALGGSGISRQQGQHPHVRMRAKNPKYRTSLRHRVKRYNARVS